ncbi:hypothetical protein ANN_23406 [Periplaneta americana]|uniref:Ig-like domain-containing protein n=1 Tax=Periplaneta americana TaxID=6978 RepID=A0ABQ8SN15_PERAM|nr:hypothetical protein ANN_23406 [Periplaneta americana]
MITYGLFSDESTKGPLYSNAEELSFNVSQFRKYVAWIKSDSKAILAIHTHMVAHNPRLSVTHNGHNTWKLHVSNVQMNDSGTYMCQINTDPMRSQKISVHNTELHSLYSSPDIIRNIKSSHLRWAGHVARMGESRNAYRVLVGRPEGKRPLGRPRRRLEDNIKMDLRKVGYDDRDWINLAQDRDRWRAYVRAPLTEDDRRTQSNQFSTEHKTTHHLNKLLQTENDMVPVYSFLEVTVQNAKILGRACLLLCPTHSTATEVTADLAAVKNSLSSPYKENPSAKIPGATYNCPAPANP